MNCQIFIDHLLCLQVVFQALGGTKQKEICAFMELSFLAWEETNNSI